MSYFTRTPDSEMATFPAITAIERSNPLLPIVSLWRREIVRFYRQKSRVVGVIVSPLLFWLVIGSGFGASFRSAGSDQDYLHYFFPGSLLLIVLFTSIFTMMSVIEDRDRGFLSSVLVAPVPRSAIVMGKVLGGTTLSGVQGLIFLVFAPAVGIHIGFSDFLIVVLSVFLMAFTLTALGFALAWRMESAQAFHAIVNLFLIPLWLLSGALFPIHDASGWIRWVMRLNPLTYGLEALRISLFPATAAMKTNQFSLVTSLGILAGFAAVIFGAAFVVVNRRTTKPAA
jgi:ABC-2 type transport system permease protein